MDHNAHNVNNHNRSDCGCEPSPCGCDLTTPSCGSNKKNKKEKKCRTYSFVTKNPYDVGITKSLSSGEFLVLLSGNHHATSDYDKDRLPDWIAIGERPCRQYKSLATEELVEYWGLKKKPCNDPCLHKTSFDVCHPNGYINYYTTDGYNRSQTVEITDATVDSSQDDHALVLKVKLLNQDGGGPSLDGLFPRMFKVSLVMNGFCYKSNNSGRGPTIIPIMEAASPPPAAAPVNISLSNIGSNDGGSATGGQATGGQATSDVKQTTTATSTSTATASIDKDKKKKKKDKKKKKCDHIKDKKKKKKCLKKLHEHEHEHEHHHHKTDKKKKD